jgi:hypothetical protein
VGAIELRQLLRTLCWRTYGNVQDCGVISESVRITVGLPVNRLFKDGYQIRRYRTMKLRPALLELWFLFEKSVRESR